MLNILKQAVLAGGDILRKYYRQKNNISYKKNIHDLVTEADRQSQKTIIDFLKKEAKKNYPKNSLGFIGEEGIFEKGEYMFIIDPLDGTTNFAAGIDYFCVSIALMKDNQIKSGVIYDVIRNNLYWSEKGKGSYKNSNKLIIPKDKRLDEAVLYFHFSSIPQKREKLMYLLQKSASHIRAMRARGAIALDISMISEGVGDIILNISTNIWDIAAAVLICEEAGGEILDLEGNKVIYDFNDPQKKYQVLIAEKHIVNEYLKILNS